ncbi:unnamed protein product [Ixodes pacificus]
MWKNGSLKLSISVAKILKGKRSLLRFKQDFFLNFGIYFRFERIRFTLESNVSDLRISGEAEEYSHGADKGTTFDVSKRFSFVVLFTRALLTASNPRKLAGTFLPINKDVASFMHLQRRKERE